MNDELEKMIAEWKSGRIGVDARATGVPRLVNELIAELAARPHVGEQWRELYLAAKGADELATWCSSEYTEHPIRLRLRRALDAVNPHSPVPAVACPVWISVKDRLPPLDLPVWLYEAGRVYIGGRGDAGDCWLWGKCYQMPYLSNGKWKLSDCEEEGDEPTHWMKLPDPPAALAASQPSGVKEGENNV